MNDVKAILRARTRNWNGRNGGCVVKDKMGLMSFERRGEA